MSSTEGSGLKVIIPVGGEARRLRPLTTESSKAVVRILNKPLVEFAVFELARQGVREFIFGAKGYVNYRSLYDYFREGTGFSSQYGMKPKINVEYQPRVDDVGSADSVRILMDYYDIRDDFLVVQGDNLFALDLPGLLRFKRKNDAFMVVVLTEVEDVEAYGIAEVDGAGRVKRFVEKPGREKAPSRLANTGIYLISPEIRRVFERPEVAEMVSKNRRLDFGLDLIPYLVERYPVYGYISRGDWKDVGTPKGYLDAVMSVLKNPGRPGLNLGDPVAELPDVWVQGESPDAARWREETVRKALSGKIKLQGRVVIGSHCQIDEGTTIVDSCVDNFCRVGKGVTIARSAVMDGAVIEEGASVEDSIIGRHVRVASSFSKPTRVAEMSVVGDDVEIGTGCLLLGTKVNPHRAVLEGKDLRGKSLD